MYSWRVRPSASRDNKAMRVSDPVTMVSTAEYGTPVYPVPAMFPICPKAAGARLAATTIAQSMRMVTPLSMNRCDSAQCVSHALPVCPGCFLQIIVYRKACGRRLHSGER
jgi:hypothetical protein